MTRTLTVTKKTHTAFRQHGRRALKAGSPPPDRPSGRVPRISRLMALAIRFDGLIRDGIVADQAELARLGHVSRARLTQIMNLLNLSPDIQEAILFLPRVEEGRDPITEHDVRRVAAKVDWAQQGQLWRQLIADLVTSGSTLQGSRLCAQDAPSLYQ